MGQMVTYMFSHLKMMAQYYTEYRKLFALPSGIDSGADNVHNCLCYIIMEIITGTSALFNLNSVGAQTVYNIFWVITVKLSDRARGKVDFYIRIPFFESVLDCSLNITFQFMVRVIWIPTDTNGIFGPSMKGNGIIERRIIPNNRVKLGERFFTNFG